MIFRLTGRHRGNTFKNTHSSSWHLPPSCAVIMKLDTWWPLSHHRNYLLIRIYDTADNGLVVSGLSSSKVWACSLVIKRVYGGEAGWTDRAIFIETDLKPASRLVRPHQALLNPGKVLPKALPSILSEILSNLRSRKYTSNNLTFSTCAGLWVPSPVPLPTSSNWSLWWTEGRSIQ